ncbi:MAG: hypothetical protein HRT57_10670 [Crocinitomicaceae bacterium]|nr:hypothetical protein [Crocinitomicaceae bacterium]
MKITIAFISLLLILSSCGGESKDSNPKEVKVEIMTEEDSLTATSDSLHIKSNMDMSLINPEDRVEFLKNLAEIEKKHGQQWNFCKCVIKNDSINKAFMNELSDAAFDKLSLRFDVIDAKCKAFLAQNPNQTPDDRARHEKKVRDCLRAEGISI